MKILFSNDDGYESVLLHDLYSYVSRVWPDATCVLMAPQHNMSGSSHAINVNKNLLVREKELNKYEVEGYPADCVLAAGCEDFGPFDLVLSGPNYGSNLGKDVIYSGTVAVAREAAFHNIPAVAFSFVDDFDKELQINYDDWHAFLDVWFQPVVQLAQKNLGWIVSLNVNTPISLDLVEGALGNRYYHNFRGSEKGRDYRGEYTVLIKDGTLNEEENASVESDVSLSLLGKNVISVFSPWPVQQSGKIQGLIEIKNSN